MSFCIELFCVVTLQYQISARNAIAYFIIDKNNSLKEELEGQEKDSSDKIKFKYIYSLEEIEI